MAVWFSIHLGADSELVFEMQEVPSIDNAAHEPLGALEPGAPLCATTRARVSVREGTFSCWAAKQ